MGTVPKTIMSPIIEVGGGGGGGGGTGERHI